MGIQGVFEACVKVTKRIIQKKYFLLIPLSNSFSKHNQINTLLYIKIDYMLIPKFLKFKKKFEIATNKIHQMLSCRSSLNGFKSGYIIFF